MMKAKMSKEVLKYGRSERSKVELGSEQVLFVRIRLHRWLNANGQRRARAEARKRLARVSSTEKRTGDSGNAV